MFHHVFVGGTFDGIHKGHQMLLATACSEGSLVTVGITSDAFAKAHKTRPVGSFEERMSDVTVWLTDNGWSTKSAIIKIENKYEPAASDPELDALIVTRENRKTGEEINEKRKARGLPVLTLIEVPMVSAQDGEPISSSRVHAGEIDPSGKFTMPETLRQELSEPLGAVISSPLVSDTITKQKGRILITVGDVVTKTFLAAGITPHLSIIDRKVGRMPDHGLDAFAATGTHIRSGPGFISRAAVAAIGAWAQNIEKDSRYHEIIVIDGEEDLLVLPVLLAAPITTMVYYGQPGRGMVEVEATLEKKKEMMELLKKFI